MSSTTLTDPIAMAEKKPHPIDAQRMYFDKALRELRASLPAFFGKRKTLTGHVRIERGAGGKRYMLLRVSCHKGRLTPRRQALVRTLVADLHRKKMHTRELDHDGKKEEILLFAIVPA